MTDTVFAGLVARMPLGLRRLGGWWLAEAARRLPTSLRPRVPVRILAEPVERGFRLIRRDPNGTDTDLGIVGRGRPLPPLPADAERILHLPDPPVMRRRFDLPPAALPHLRRVVALELERRTPLRADQAYFAAEAVGTAAEGRSATVEVHLLPQVAARDAVEALAALGFGVERIALRSAEGRALLLPLDESRPAPSRRAPLARVAMVGLAGLVLLVAVAYAGLSWRLATLEARMAETAREAAAVREQADALDRARARAFHAVAAKLAAPSPIVLVEALSRLLPDGAWLTDLSFDGDSVTLTGIGQDGSALLQAIESSPHFTAAQFRSAVTRDAQGFDRFDIVAKVEPHAAP